MLPCVRTTSRASGGRTTSTTTRQSIRKDATYNYKSEHFEFMLCEEIIERGFVLGEDMLTLFAEIQNMAFILYPESVLLSKTQLQELLMTTAWFMSPTLRANGVRTTRRTKNKVISKATTSY